MRFLILSCNTGEGHNSCARAIREICEDRGDVCDVADALEFISSGVSHFISGWHVRIYRYMPEIFRVGYRFSEKHPPAFTEKSFVYRLFDRGTEKLYAFLQNGRYDAVLCTHVFAALMLTNVRKAHPLALRTAFVATDYTCSPMTKDSRLDRYFVPARELEAEFASPDIPKSRITGCGIPVRQAFYQCGDRESAKRAVGIEPSHRHLLMMCGSMGCGPIRRLTDRLAKEMPANGELTVVCGTNRRLQRRLQKKHGNDARIHIRGFVEDMPLLMDSADLYLTKPGGISVTEAAVKALPMVYVEAVAGCEKYNRRYFDRLGGGVAGKGVREIASLCRTILEDDAKRLAMSEALRQHPFGNAAVSIYDDMCVGTESSGGAQPL